MEIHWNYCTLEEQAQGDAVQARAVAQNGTAGGMLLQEYSSAGEGLFHLGSAGWELVSVVRETQPACAAGDPNLVLTYYHLKQPEVNEVWRHCLMVSTNADEGIESSAIIWYLDWLDAQGVPHSQGVVSQYTGFKLLGDDGWKLVQVIAVPSSIGMDGPVPATTEFYFTRPARSRG